MVGNFFSAQIGFGLKLADYPQQAAELSTTSRDFRTDAVLIANWRAEKKISGGSLGGSSNLTCFHFGAAHAGGFVSCCTGRLVFCTAAFDCFEIVPYVSEESKVDQNVQRAELGDNSHH